MHTGSLWLKSSKVFALADFDLYRRRILARILDRIHQLQPFGRFLDFRLHQTSRCRIVNILSDGPIFYALNHLVYNK